MCPGCPPSAQTLYGCFRKRSPWRRSHDPRAQLLVHSRMVQEVDVSEPRELAAVVDLERDPTALAGAASRRARDPDQQVADERADGTLVERRRDEVVVG